MGDSRMGQAAKKKSKSFKKAAESWLARTCGGIIEAGWLVAIVVVPLHFNPYTSRTFEPDKVALLRTLAIVMVAAWLIIGIEKWPFSRRDRSLGQIDTQGNTSKRLGRLVLIGVLLVLASQSVSALLSILPHISLLGNYDRMHGLLSMASYAVLFFSLVGLLRKKEQLDRIITALILASIPMALYGFLQFLNVDPLSWVLPVSERVQATMGNPVFLSATLCLILPLTLFRVIQVWKGKGAKWTIALYGGIGIAQLACIFFTQSRGPILGMFVGGFVALLLWLSIERKKRAVQGLVGASMIVLALLTGLNFSSASQALVKDVPLLNRLTQIEDQQGSSRARVLMWEGALRMISSDPVRLGIGYGPETIRFAYYPYYAAKIGRIHGEDVFPDRLHNENMDVLATTGILGLITYVFLLTCIIGYLLSLVGLIESRGQALLFFGTILFSIVASLLAAYGMFDTWRYLGVSLTAGWIMGTILFMAVPAFIPSLAVRTERREAPSLSVDVLICLLLFGIVAHTVEISVGISVSASRLYFFMYVAIVVALGFRTISFIPISRKSSDTRDKSKGRSSTSGKQKGRRLQLPTAPIARIGSVLVGIVLIPLGYGFSSSASATDHSALGLGLLVLTWLVGGVIVLTAQALYKGSGPTIRALLSFIGLSLAPALLFYILITWKVNVGSHFIFPFYGCVLLLLLVLGIFIAQEEKSATRRPSISTALVGVLAVGLAILAIYSLSINPVLASMSSLKAQVASQQGRHSMAVDYAREAAELDPTQDVYHLNYAQKLSWKVHQLAKAESERVQGHLEVEQYLVDARHRNSYEQAYPISLSRNYQLWAQRTNSRPEKEDRYETAIAYIDEALAIAPENTLLWEKKAEMFLENDDSDSASSTYQGLLQLDSTDTPTLMKLGQIYRDTEQWSSAINTYKQVIELSMRTNPTLHLVLAELYQNDGRLELAIEEAVTFVNLSPEESAGYLRLAELYLGVGRCSEAQDQIHLALQKWPNDETLIKRATEVSEGCDRSSTVD